jgi:hypothetical protein
MVRYVTSAGGAVSHRPRLQPRVRNLRIQMKGL